MIDYGYGVILGTLDEKCLETIRTWRNDLRIWQWCRQNDLITEIGHSDWYRRQATDPLIRMYSVKRDDRLVGVCGLTSIDTFNRRAEFSLYIDPDKQNEGLGKAALKTLLHHGYYNLGLNCIWGETFDGNPAVGMFESLGMTKEGTRRDFYYRSGRFIDAHLYSLLRRDFDSSLQAGQEGHAYPRPSVAVTTGGGADPEASLRPFDLSTWECKEKTARA